MLRSVAYREGVKGGMERCMWGGGSMWKVGTGRWKRDSCDDFIMTQEVGRVACEHDHGNKHLALKESGKQM
jgi:hypothetical protein